MMVAEKNIQEIYLVSLEQGSLWIIAVYPIQPLVFFARAGLPVFEVQICVTSVAGQIWAYCIPQRGMKQTLERIGITY